MGWVILTVVWLPHKCVYWMIIRLQVWQYLMSAYIIKIWNIWKFWTRNYWPAHRIQHTRVRRIVHWMFRCRILTFSRVDFTQGKSPIWKFKVSLKEVILERTWMVKTKKLLLHITVEPEILNFTQTLHTMTSSWCVMTSSKILRF